MVTLKKITPVYQPQGAVVFQSSMSLSVPKLLVLIKTLAQVNYSATGSITAVTYTISITP